MPVKIKLRRSTGATAPTTTEITERGEPAFVEGANNGSNNPGILYFRKEDDTIIPIAGEGAFARHDIAQSFAENVTFEKDATVNGDLSVDFDITASGGLTVSGAASVASAGGELNVNSSKIINVASPDAGADATNKDYVDGLVQGIQWQESVIALQSDPPDTPNEGDRYLVDANATTDWLGREDDIAEWDGSAWVFTSPTDGFATWLEDEDRVKVYNGTNWVKFGSTITHNNLAGLNDGDFQHLTTAEHGRIEDWDAAYDESSVGLAGDGNSTLTITRRNTTDLSQDLSHTHPAGDLPATVAYTDAANNFSQKQHNNAGIIVGDGSTKGVVELWDGTTADTKIEVDGSNRLLLTNTSQIRISAGVTTYAFHDSQLDMASQPIQNVSDPSTDQDAATKGYVDTAVGAVDEGVWNSGTGDQIYYDAGTVLIGTAAGDSSYDLLAAGDTVVADNGAARLGVGMGPQAGYKAAITGVAGENLEALYVTGGNVNLDGNNLEDAVLDGGSF